MLVGPINYPMHLHAKECFELAIYEKSILLLITGHLFKSETDIESIFSRQLTINSFSLFFG